MAEASPTKAFALETTALTAAYWAAAFLFVIAFWVTPFPPLIDYPQHIAVGALLRRLADPESVERGIYDVNLVTYNGGFHVLVAALSFVVRPETAGRLLLSVYPLALAYASLELMRVASRPRWYAFLVLPITMSFAVGWGFANYFLSVPFVVLTFCWWLRAERGETRLVWVVMLASFLLSYTHVLATLCLCVTIGVAGLLSLPKGGLAARALFLVKLPLAVWPAIAWSTAVFVHNRYSPHANWEGWDDGIDDPLWYKLGHLMGYSVGNFADHSDQLLLSIAVGALILLYGWRAPKTRPERLMGGLAVLWATLYCVVPKVFIATWFIFERFPTFVLVFAVAAAPVVLQGSLSLRWVRAGAATLAVAAAINTVLHFRLIPDEKDAEAIIDEIPPGRRVIAVTWSNTGRGVILREMWVHLLAYYQARRPGLIAYSFAKFESMPVHYAIGKTPPVIPGGMEWDAAKYDISQPYARYWDTVMVRTPDEDPTSDPCVRTFGAAAAVMKVLAHHGRFWLYDASALRETSFVVPDTQPIIVAVPDIDARSTDNSQPARLGQFLDGSRSRSANAANRPRKNRRRRLCRRSELPAGLASPSAEPSLPPVRSGSLRPWEVPDGGRGYGCSTAAIWQGEPDRVVLLGERLVRGGPESVVDGSQTQRATNDPFVAIVTTTRDEEKSDPFGLS